jgi:quinol monooxygenase YgiN
MYCYVWSFLVRPEHVKEFEAAYGPYGDWARLFRHDPQYVRTDLLRDRENPARFLTVDFWSSREACSSFRERFSGQFEALDKSFERFTAEEVHLGDFDVLSERG